MEENRDQIPEEELPPAKTPWQVTKESWYDKLPVTLKQMDIIVTVCWVLIGLLVLCIALDAMGIISPFS